MRHEDCVLLLPTYNERENLEALVQAVRASYGGKILVIDDHSPDGTGQIADALSARDARLSVLHREAKQGLGRAYVDGMKRAMEQGAEAILTMDVDFSHDPALVPSLIAALDDADLIIGSRYFAGGATPGWPWFRRVLSRAANLYARTFLGPAVRDYTGGFRAYRSAALQTIALDSLQASGYAFQVEAAYRLLRNGFRVREIPIQFTERVCGDSKLSPRIGLEAAVLIPRWGLGRLFRHRRSLPVPEPLHPYGR